MRKESGEFCARIRPSVGSIINNPGAASCLEFTYLSKVCNPKAGLIEIDRASAVAINFLSMAAE